MGVLQITGMREERGWKKALGREEEEWEKGRNKVGGR